MIDIEEDFPAGFPTVSRHEYDIDAFEIIDNLRKKLIQNLDSIPKHLQDLKFIDEEETHLLKAMKEKEVDLTENLKYRNYILPSSYNLYNTYLGWKLLTMDIYKIEPLLSYQSVLFLGNDYASSENFIGLVEFHIYTFVKTRIFFNENLRLEKIVNWLERNRIFLINKAYNSSDTIVDDLEVEATNIIDEKKEDEIIPLSNVTLEALDVESPEVKEQKENEAIPLFRTITMDPQFAKTFVEKLEPYFEKKHHQNLYNLIMLNKTSEKLSFKGNSNVFAELFKRLRYNKKIYVLTNDHLAKWLTENFNLERNPNKVEELNLSSVLAVLRKTEKEPTKDKIILEELAQYILPSQRKK